MESVQAVPFSGSRRPEGSYLLGWNSEQGDKVGCFMTAAAALDRQGVDGGMGQTHAQRRQLVVTVCIPLEAPGPRRQRRPVRDGTGHAWGSCGTWGWEWEWGHTE